MNATPNPDAIDVVLERLKQFDAQSEKHAIPGRLNIIGETAGKFLAMLVAIMEPRKIVDIGCGSGYSTISLARGVETRATEIWAIDSDDSRLDAASKIYAATGCESTVHWIHGHAPEALFDVPKADLYLIDCDKSDYVSCLVEIIARHRKERCTVVADNCVSHRDELSDFFDLAESHPQLTSLLLPIEKGLQLIAVRPEVQLRSTEQDCSRNSLGGSAA